MKKVTIQYTIPNSLEVLCRRVIVSVLDAIHVKVTVIKIEHMKG